MALNWEDEPGESEMGHGKGIISSEKQREQMSNPAGDPLWSGAETLMANHRACTEANSLDPDYELDYQSFTRED